MWGILISAVVQMLPGIIGAVEALFTHQPKSGLEKLNATTQLVINGLAIAHIIDPKQIGDPEVALAQEVSTAIVKYNNARGIFNHLAG
jgi:hypothetical protein